MSKYFRVVAPVLGAALLLCSVTFCRSDSMRPSESIGADEVSSASTTSRQFTGKTFIFLHRTHDDSDSGKDYYGFTTRITDDGTLDSTYASTDFTLGDYILYDKFVGRTVTCVSILRDGRLVFHDNDYELTIYGHIAQGTISGIAPVDELNIAKKQWLGKTVYAKERGLSTYDASSDTTAGFEIKVGEPLKVVDCIWGNNSNNPVWVVVQRKNGQKGFYSIACDDTNSDPDFTSHWYNEWFMRNPRNVYRWGNSVWNQIANGQISIGMTKDQVRLSWGSPSSTNDGTYNSVGENDQWVYSEGYVYFDNGRCSAIQNIDTGEAPF